MEGLFGAIFLPTFVSLVFYNIGQVTNGNYATKLPLSDYLVLGVICGFLAVLGDLAESFLKRCTNLKDSSNLLGAHGGMFDRIDSLLLNVPFVLWYALQYMDLKNQPGYDEN